jgi:hypothetical protein
MCDPVLIATSIGLTCIASSNLMAFYYEEKTCNGTLVHTHGRVLLRHLAALFGPKTYPKYPRTVV